MKGLIVAVVAAVLAFSLVGAARATLPVNPTFSEDFNYASGTDLRNTTAWDGTAASEIEIDAAGSWLKMSGTASTLTAYQTQSLNYGGVGNVIWIHLLAKPGPGSGTSWGLWFDDPSGNSIARWYGSSTTCRGRLGGTNTVTDSATLTTGVWNDLDIKVNTSANTSEFYCNGLLLGTVNHTGAGDTIGKVRFETIGNSSAIGSYLNFDELRMGEDQPATVPPGAPTVTAPTSGSTVQTFTPTIQWAGDGHDMFEVHVNTTDSPTGSSAWDSGQVTNAGNSCVTGVLPNYTQYYVYVRLHNNIGWGDWSAAGHNFTVSLNPPAAPTVTAPTGVVQTSSATVSWSGDAHDMYEVHINTTNVAADANVWNSGQVTSAASSCTSGMLPNNTRCYAFARLGNAAGWGNWSFSSMFDVSIPVRIIPEPQERTTKGGTGFTVNAQTKIVMNSSPDSKDTFTANQLRRKVWDMTGFLPEIVQGTAGAPTSNVIAIGDPTRNTAVSSIIATWTEATGKAAKSEGYMLGVKNDSIVIRGYDQSGTFYGCQTLIQYLEYYKTAAIAGLFIYDYPDLAMRGTMIRVWDSMDAEFLREVISEVMARHKLNYLQLDLGLGFIWPSHPELYYNLPPEEQRANPTTLAMVVPIVEWARQHFMDVIPSGPSWSHADGCITQSILNPTLREKPNEADPAPSLETLCPRHPTAQQIMHDLWNDMITYLNPRYIHAGWDEISAIGDSTCPRCAGQNKANLFSEFLWNDRNWLMARNVTPIMWADMLRPDMNGGSPWNLQNTLATMPRDTILEDWEYLESRDNNASVVRWNSYGQPNLASPYGGYNPFEVNIFNWASIAKNNSTRGLVAFNKFRCGTKAGLWPNPNQYMETSSMVFYGEYSWTANRPAISPLPYDGKAIVRSVISPDKPVGFAAGLNAGNVRLTWTTPTDTTYQATYVVYRTDRYATDPTDGILVVDVAGPANTAQQFVHTAAPVGATIYYTAFSRDGVRHFSPAVNATYNNGSPLILASLKDYEDGRAVNVAQGVVTCVLEDCFYVTNDKRTTGLRVEWSGTPAVSVREIVTVNGILGKTGHERSLTALSVAVTGQKPVGDTSFQPLVATTSVVGGADKGCVPGNGGIGTNNVGLYITTMGKIEDAVAGQYFYLNDGSGNRVKVMLTGAKTALSVPTGTYAVVTGASSLDTDGNAAIRPAAQIDIVSML